MPKKKNNSESLFVKEKLVDFAAGSSNQVYSDTVYGYLRNVLDEYYKTQDSKLLPKMIGKVSGGSPYSPSALAFEYGADEIGLQIEYEFSPKYIIRTVLDVVRSYEGDGLNDRYRSEVRRDVITGSFTYKGGKLRGLADSFLTGIKEYGGEDREYFRAKVLASDGNATSLSSLRESGSTFASVASIDVYRDSLSSYSGSEFFASGWSDSPFVPNLI